MDRRAAPYLVVADLDRRRGLVAFDAEVDRDEPVALAESAPGLWLAAAGPAAGGVAPPLPDQAPAVERVLALDGVQLPVPADAAVASVAVLHPRHQDHDVPSARASTRREQPRRLHRPLYGHVGKPVYVRAGGDYPAAIGPAVVRERAAGHGGDVLKPAHRELQRVQRSPARTPRAVYLNADLGVRALHEHIERLPGWALAFAPPGYRHAGRVADKVHRPHRPKARGGRPQAERYGRRPVCGQREVEAVPGWRGRRRSGLARGVLPLQHHAVEGPAAGRVRTRRKVVLLPSAPPVYHHGALVDEVRGPFRPRRREAVPETVSDELVGRSDVRGLVCNVSLEGAEPREQNVVGHADRQRVERLRHLVPVSDAVAVGVIQPGVRVIREKLVPGGYTVPVPVCGDGVLGVERAEGNGERGMEEGE